MSVDASGIVLHLTGFYLLQEVGDIFVIGQGNLNAHIVQTLHRRLSHAAANKKLTVADVIEFSHVCGIAAHATGVFMIMVVVMIMMVMVGIADIGHLA